MSASPAAVYSRFLWAASLVTIAGGAASLGWTDWDVDPFGRSVTWLGAALFAALVVSASWKWPYRVAAAGAAAATRRQIASGGAGAGGTEAAKAGAKKRGTIVTRFLAWYVEPFFAWVAAYPFFPLPFLFFWFVSWLGLGEGLGFPDLVWSDSWWERYWVGTGVSLVFGTLLFVRYLLDHRPGRTPPALFGESPTLFFLVPRPLETDQTDEAVARRHVRRLGAFLLWSWLISLAVFYLPKFASDKFGSFSGCGAMAAGLAAGVGGFVLLVVVYESTVKTWWQSRNLFKSLPGFNAPAPYGIPADERDLHGIASAVAAIPTGFLVLVLIENQFFGAVWSPVWLLCLYVGAFTTVYGFVAYHFGGLQYVLFAIAFAIIFVGNKSFPNKMTFPGLEDYAPREKWVDPNATLPPDPADAGAVTAYTASQAAYDRLKLLKTADVLTTFESEYRGKRPGPTKPKLVIVATSGGGIQAAVWTAVVLEGLERELSPAKTNGTDFRDHIRLMTGASGGMQGAALYAAAFHPRRGPAEPKLSDQLARDSLWRAVNTMLLNDLPALVSPRRLASDRGRALEEAWDLNTRPWRDRDGALMPEPPDWSDRVLTPGDRERWFRATEASPFARSFESLKADEAACRRPSLIFAPMLVEDCRRVVISNLEMAWFTTADGANLNKPVPGVPPDRIAVPALEFWRLFPGAYPEFRIGTAARMSATFPFVGPAVSLPMNPPRRVVDAGYFDNFGINAAALWLYRHKRAIEKHTSGVVIVEIRAYPRREEKLRVRGAAAGDGGGPISWGLSELSTPAEALGNLYAPSAYFRNDQLLDVLDKEFNPAPPGGKPVPRHEKFFTCVAFECNQPAALSWTLPARGKDSIRRQFYSDYDVTNPDPKVLAPAIGDEVENLRTWFGGGGK